MIHFQSIVPPHASYQFAIISCVSFISTLLTFGFFVFFYARYFIMPYYNYYTNHFDPVNCAVRPVVPSLVSGGLLSALDMAQGGHINLRTFGMYAGGIYMYNLIQCPMEAVNGGRPSAWHNVLAGGMLGYVGVSRRWIGIPFMDSYFFYRYPQVAPEVAGAAVYGAMAGALAMLGGKPF